MRFITSVLIAFICNSLYCQDFMFKWQIWPSFNKGYTVFIDRKDNNGIMLINEDGTSRFTKRKVSQKDCALLNSVLETYEFPHKPSILQGAITREYYNTKVLNDTSWVIIDGDSLRRSLAWAHGSDYKLNLLICDLMIRYNRSNYFIWLRQVIDADRPGK
ncbi:MAG TPA: hypothetical protein VK179_03895 [Bacteroidales bacterium]|nr:hypothetical protein [Bacteroidales bacterium]